MGDITLVVMAAGIGSRFGKGVKQLTTVGPHNETIMEYSVRDAAEAGFNKVVFVIRRELEEEFRTTIGRNIEGLIKVEYVYQELGNIPDEYKEKFVGRTKPWGTGHAIICCKKVLDGPFLVINADDYYGSSVYKKAYDFLSEHPAQLCMMAYMLKNTLSEHGGVTRGICTIDEGHHLKDVEEVYSIIKEGDYVVGKKDGQKAYIDLDSYVSMNMWGMPVEFISTLERGFVSFLSGLSENDNETEYLLPKIIGGMLKKGTVQVEVLESEEQWIGVTYKEDIKMVKNWLKELL